VNPLDANPLKARADEILDVMPEDGRSPGDRIANAVEMARAELNGQSESIRITPAQDFAAVEEPGAEPLVGANGEVLISEDGNVMFYGDGGASKTTLSIDLAAGDPWLDAPVPRPARVLIIEAEGPRPLFRQKLRRKLEGWDGSDVGDRLYVLEAPWAEFRFPDAEEIAALVGEYEIDALIVGPLTRVGMDELGTLQQVRDFMDKAVKPFRAATGRRLTIVLVHHENKGGAVSGAWEGAGDTLFHAQVHARGKTILTVQKARWSSEWHKRTLELGWTDGEGFEVIEEEERHLEAEIARLLADRPHLTAKEIAAPEEAGGIAAAPDTVRGVLETNPERFTSRRGEGAKAVGRHPSAKVWALSSEVVSASNHLKPPGLPGGGDGLGDLGDFPVRESPNPKSPPPRAPTGDLTAKPPPLATPEEEARAARLLDEEPT
jgi:AAA domain-containing protein